MKISLDIDCTPAEARSFFGLPDVESLQQALMKDVEQRMRANLQVMDPEAMLKAWMPMGLKGFEQLQRGFWEQMSAAATGAKPK